MHPDEPPVLLPVSAPARAREVAAAAGGASALAQLRRQPVDLVVTDLGMPDMTGWEVAEAVKGLPPRHPGHPDDRLAGPDAR